MRLAQVRGQVVSTVKESTLNGLKLLVCHDFGADGTVGEVTFVAVDLVGAGNGEVVLIAEGSAARATEATGAAPVDAAAIGIVDSVIVEGTATYTK